MTLLSHLILTATFLAAVTIRATVEITSSGSSKTTKDQVLARLEYPFQDELLHWLPVDYAFLEDISLLNENFIKGVLLLLGTLVVYQQRKDVCYN